MVASMIRLAFAEIIQDNATKQESSAQTSKSEESKTIEEWIQQMVKRSELA